MKRLLRFILIAILILVIVVAINSFIPRPSPVLYTIKSLPDGFIRGINNKGQILMRESDPDRSFILEPDGSNKEIVAEDGRTISANCITNSGRVLGWIYDATPYPVIWSATDGTERLVFDRPEDIDWFGPKRMNDTGLFYGYVSVGEDSNLGIWSATRVIYNSTHESFLGINDKGVVTGFSSMSDSPFCFSEEHGKEYLTREIDHFTPKGINNNGHVVGEGGYPLQTTLEHVKAFLRIGEKPSASWNIAFLYRDGDVIDLNYCINSLTGWNLYGGFDINDQGQIVGYGSRGKFLLTPIEEPERPQDDEE